jgi:outer membrane cobalamin receptor
VFGNRYGTFTLFLCLLAFSIGAVTAQAFELDDPAATDIFSDEAAEGKDGGMSIDDVLDLDALSEEADIFANAWVVTGTKQKRRSIDSPFSVFTLDREQIEALKPMDIVDLLRAVPGLDVFRVRDGVINASEPGYSTEAGSQYLVLIDGVSYCNTRGRSADWSTLPIQVDEIERIEYLPGAQSTLYGSYAAVGVVNIITRRANPDTWDDKASSLRLRTGSDGLGQYEFTHHAKSDDYYSTIWGTFREIDDGVDPANVPAPAFADQGASTLRRFGYAGKKQLDGASDLRFDSNYTRGTKDSYLPMYSTQRPEDIQEISGMASYTKEFGDDDTFNFLVKNRNNKDSSIAGSNNFSDFQLEARRQFKDQRDRVFTFGGYYQRFELSGDSHAPGDHKLFEKSVNALMEQPLSDTQSIFVGINGYHSSYTHSDFSYKLSYKKDTADNEAFRLSYGTSVKGPDIFFNSLDIVSIPLPPTMTPVVFLDPTADLDNEEFDFAELSYERRTTVSSVQARVYKGTLKNRAIFYRTSDTPYDIFGNQVYPLGIANDEGESEQIGVTTTWDRRYSSKWRSTLTYRYLRATNSDGQDSWYSPKHVANLVATYKPDEKHSLALFTKTCSSYITDDESASFTGTDPSPGYTKFDFIASVKTNRDLSQELWLRVDNLTDKEVVESYGLSGESLSPGFASGRRVSVGYSFKF